jgi:hypothetical protein
LDRTDYKILEAIRELRVARPKADRINSKLGLDPEELGARLGVLEMQGYVKTQSDMEIPGVTLPCGIYSASITPLGKRALDGERW